MCYSSVAGEIQDKSRATEADPGSCHGAKPSHVQEKVFTLGDARSFHALTSKIPPLGSILKFDADVAQCENCQMFCTPFKFGNQNYLQLFRVSRVLIR